MKNPILMMFLLFVAGLVLIGCGGASSPPLSSDKSITAFGFASPPANGTVTEATHSITLTVPFGTDVTALAPNIVHNGASVSPASGDAQNFTAPVVYTVTAADSSTQDYTVTVTVAPSSAKAITAFGFAAIPTAVVTITEATHTISAAMPSGTDATSLTPTVVHTGASVSPASGAAQDFSSPVTYTVTAADSSTQDYTVTVTVNPWAVCGDVLTYAGENYPTVQIGTQCWLAKNLNVGTMILVTSGQGTSCATIQKHCYDDNPANCTTYGGLYSWNQAMCGASDEGSQGICPTGWHVPSDPEYVTLTNYLGPGGCSTYRSGNSNFCGAPAGDRMKAAGLCEGRTPCGDSGFNGLMAGSSGGGSFANLSVETNFWTSSLTPSPPSGAGNESWRSGLRVDQSGVNGTFYWSDRATGFAIRCVKD